MKRLLAVVALAFAPAAAFAECALDIVDLRGDWGSARFKVEVADDPRERGVGLMNRPSMPQTAGMLFIYETPQRATFWMRNTLIELDMLFIDPQGVIKHIHHRAQPLDETPILGGRDLTHVLEINGGKAEQLGIQVGDVIRHPSFAQETAAWPC